MSPSDSSLRHCLRFLRLLLKLLPSTRPPTPNTSSSSCNGAKRLPYSDVPLLKVSYQVTDLRVSFILNNKQSSKVQRILDNMLPKFDLYGQDGSKISLLRDGWCGHAIVRGKRKVKQLDSISDEEDTKEQTSDEEVSKGIIEADTISNLPKKLKTKKLAGRKPIEVTSSSVPKDSHERHAQSQYDLRVRLPKNQGINIEQATPRTQPLRKRPRIVVETQETQATEESQHITFNRCNMQAMIRSMKGFPVTPALKDSLKKTPFWHLINAFIEEKVKSEHCRKFDEVVVKIVKSYDANTRTFTLGNKHVKLEREDVKLIFGITCGNEEIDQGYCKKEDVQLVVKWKIKEKRLDTSIIKKLLKEKQNSKLEEDMDDIARLLCLSLCGTLFFSTSRTTINWVYVRYMKDLNTIKQFDWTETICKYLLKSTHVEHKNPKEVKGSSILLLQDQLQQDAGEKDEVNQHEKVKEGTLKQTIEEKVDSEFEQHEVQQDAGEKVEVNQHEVKNDVELVETQFEVKQDEREKVEVAEVEKVPNSCGLDDFDTPTNMFQSPLCSCKIVESQPVSFRRDEVTSPKYNSDSTLEPNTLSGKSLPQEEDECLKKLVDNILDDSKMNALAMIDELRKEKDSITNDKPTKIERLENEKNQMEIEKESICEPLNDEIAKLKKLDMIEKVESLEKEKKQLELQKLKMREDNDIVLQSKDQQIHTLARKIEEIEEEIKNQIQNLDKQNKKLCLAKDRYIQTLLNKVSVLEKQKAKQQDINNVLQMQIDEFKIHEIRRLECEKEELELELLDIRVHEERRKRKAEKSLISPNSNIIALKARERKDTNADFVYEEVKKKTKTGKELFIDVDDLVESQEDERENKKLRKLKANAESVDAYMNILMQQHVDQHPTFILETPPAKSFVFLSFFVRKLIADYINSHSKSSAGKSIGNTVHIEQFSLQKLDGFVKCGVVIIFLMKQYLMNQERSKVISMEECRKTKVEMMLPFLSEQSKLSTSKVPQPVQNLKQIAES
ncbi:hypothetical protein RHSIM_Rhsim08G0151400 [Rhododendron simsii]|uniref:Uncharacterized protein n=1 Tax=Rhododendron simsii TaxID=118357 RepID=A0A834LHT1_RHOSS|nr:hypothetical protein RHSIM_Rhsim08G0151400 [Rhododendron simsii]